MELDDFRLILDKLEPGMALTVPKDWVGLHVDGADETQRDLNTIELVLKHECSWERHPETNHLTFSKQAPTLSK